jgi:2-C-methyl-D-erythritol 4-phosphate cytidylyltransferase/2-C-methyl-D-erythritol 2,4-cyclodiphosphate synthase
MALGESGGLEVTDEARLAELAGCAVRLVEGDPRNVKVTTAVDLTVARALAAGEAAPGGAGRHLRIGLGYDSHRLVAGRRLILGGVEIPFEKGLMGHSDADAVAHAVTDAVLGAAALGDIGELFPDTDPRWHDADSLQLLAEAGARARTAGVRVVNVDVTVVAERPRLGPHRAAMSANIARALGVSADAVSIKAKTNEGLDATGRGEAIMVHAVALVERTAGESAANEPAPR